MSFLRKFGRGLAGFLFTLSLLATMSVYSLVNFTQLDTINQVVSNFYQNAPEGRGGSYSDVEPAINLIKEDCRKTGLDTITTGPELGGITIKCSDVSNVDANNFQSFVASTISNTIYYKTYDCSFIECLRRGEQIMPLIITNFAHEFYKQILIYIVGATILFGAIFVWLAENMKQRLKGLGFSLLWSSLPLVALSYFTDNLATSFIPSELFAFVQPILGTFFAPTFMIYVYILVAAIALLVSGYLLKSESKKA